jgi:hypothetical protein
VKPLPEIAAAFAVIAPRAEVSSLRRDWRFNRSSGRHLLQCENYFDRIELQDFCKSKKFDDVDAALPTFKPSHKGLILAKARREIGLRHARRLSLLNEQLDQNSMTR